MTAALAPRLTPMSALFPMRIRFEREGWRGLGPRFYAMTLGVDLQLGLFDDGSARGWVLTITRGALGTQRKCRETVRQERFALLTSACERWGGLATRRRQRGYTEATS